MCGSQNWKNPWLKSTNAERRSMRRSTAGFCRGRRSLARMWRTCTVYDPHTACASMSKISPPTSKSLRRHYVRCACVSHQVWQRTRCRWLSLFRRESPKRCRTNTRVLSHSTGSVSRLDSSGGIIQNVWALLRTRIINTLVRRLVRSRAILCSMKWGHPNVMRWYREFKTTVQPSGEACVTCQLSEGRKSALAWGKNSKLVRKEEIQVQGVLSMADTAKRKSDALEACNAIATFSLP